MPHTQSWSCGISNIRGRLLSISDLPAYVTDQSPGTGRAGKVMCLTHPEHYCGVMVDQVFGIQHFNTQSYFKYSKDLNGELDQFCQGYFMDKNKALHVFMLRDLLNNQRFMNPSL